MVAAIVAVDNNWGIGRNGDLLVNIPKDKKFFKEMTDGSTVIMGRKTWDSLPKKPLPNRMNYIISSKAKKCDNEIAKYISLAEAIEMIRKTSDNEKVFIIGGGQIYRELLPYCDTVYLTKIYGDYGADTFFPNINCMGEWKIINYSEAEYSDEFPPYQFIKYEKI